MRSVLQLDTIKFLLCRVNEKFAASAPANKRIDFPKKVFWNNNMGA